MKEKNFYFFMKMFLVVMVLAIAFISLMTNVLGIYPSEKIKTIMWGNYPAVGNYYVYFFENDEHIDRTVVIYEQEIYDETIDLSNLILYINTGKGYIIEKDEKYSDKRIRIMLLSEGLAKLADEEIANNEEVMAQKKAKENKVGIWQDDVKEKEGLIQKVKKEIDVKVHIILDYINEWSTSNGGKIIKFILIDIIGLSAVIAFIIKLSLRKKIGVVFIGETLSGKTTLVNRIVNPDIEETDLRNNIKSTPIRYTVKGERRPYGKKDIYPRLRDTKGGDFGVIVDEFGTSLLKTVENKVLVCVVSFSAYCENDKENEYIAIINSQISAINAVIKSIKSSKKICNRVEKVIVFFNKIDILCDSLDEYKNNKEKYEKIFKDAYDYEDIIKNADSYIFGSALKGWGLEKLLKEICS